MDWEWEQMIRSYCLCTFRAPGIRKASGVINIRLEGNCVGHPLEVLLSTAMLVEMRLLRVLRITFGVVALEVLLHLRVS